MSIKVRNIIKKYSEVIAVNDVTFDISKGELFGFIGPDGAGKTTLFRILTTLLIPDSGEASLEGYDVVKDYKKIRKIIGYMPGRFSLYQDLSVEENLKFYATIFGTTIEENYDLIKDIYSQIEPYKKRLAGKLSGGMKQKLALSCAMIHKPVILILDEPTTGVDAVSRKEFWEMLKKLKTDGITIIVSTPYMDEADLCDRIALMQNGKIMAIDNPQNITNTFSKELFAIRSDNMFQLLNDLKSNAETANVYPFGQVVHFTFKSKIEDMELTLQNYLKDKKHTKIEIYRIKPNVEDCFMELMNNNEK